MKVLYFPRRLHSICQDISERKTTTTDAIVSASSKRYIQEFMVTTYYSVGLSCNLYKYQGDTTASESQLDPNCSRRHHKRTLHFLSTYTQKARSKDAIWIALIAAKVARFARLFKGHM